MTDAADPGSTRLRVLLVDAEPMQREGWRLVLDAQPDLEVVAQAADGVAALAVLRVHRIDVALVDVRLPRLGGVPLVERAGLDAQVRLVQGSPTTPVVLVTATDLDRYRPLGLAAGAHAVLYKDVPPEELLGALRAAAASSASASPPQP